MSPSESYARWKTRTRNALLVCVLLLVTIVVLNTWEVLPKLVYERLFESILVVAGGIILAFSVFHVFTAEDDRSA